jgi:hypothetical protein
MEVYIMADRNSILVQSERTLHYCTYTGTRDNLIASGIAAATMFPKAPKRVMYGSCSDDSPDDFWKITAAKGGLFQLRVWHKPQISLTSWRQPEKTAALPDTISAHREKLLARVTDVERFAQGFLIDEDGFYRLSAGDQQKLSEAWTHIRSLIHNATIRPRRFGVIEGGRC